MISGQGAVAAAPSGDGLLASFISGAAGAAPGATPPGQVAETGSTPGAATQSDQTGPAEADAAATGSAAAPGSSGDHAALSGQAALQASEGAPTKDGRARPAEIGSDRQRPKHESGVEGQAAAHAAVVSAGAAASPQLAPGASGQAAAGALSAVAGSVRNDPQDGPARVSAEPAGPGQAGIVPTRPEHANAPVFASLVPGPLTPGPSDGASPSGPASGQVLTDVPVGRVPIEIGLKSLEGVNRFEIRLTPDDLGRVDVRLDIESDGQVTAYLVVERPETLGMLTRERVHLERALEQAGFKPSDTGVGFSLRDGTADGGRGQSNADGQPHARARSVVFDEAPRGVQASELDIPASLKSRRATGIDLRI